MKASHNSKWLFTGGSDHNLKQWRIDIEGILLIKEYKNVHIDCIRFIEINETDDKVFTGGNNGDIVQWKVIDGVKLKDSYRYGDSRKGLVISAITINC